MKILLRWGLPFLIVLAGILLYFLALASTHRDQLPITYNQLVAVNTGLILILVGILGYFVVRLVWQYQARLFGAVLSARLVLMCTILAIVPSLLIYIASVQFLSQSIESWFSTRIEKSLKAGLEVAHITFDDLSRNITLRGHKISTSLKEVAKKDLAFQLNRLAKEQGLTQVSILDSQGQLLEKTGEDIPGYVYLPPSLLSIQKVLSGEDYIALEPFGGTTDGYAPARNIEDAPKTTYPNSPYWQIHLLTPVFFQGGTDKTYVLQVQHPIPESLRLQSEKVEQGYQDYQVLSLERAGLRKIFTITLSLILSVTMLISITLAIVFANRMVTPLSVLARGTAAIAAGDFTPRTAIPGRSELDLLTQSFAQMTEQLRDARENILQQQSELARARDYLDKILVHLSAGVLVLDPNMNLISANLSARHLLGLPSEISIGGPLITLSSKSLLVDKIIALFQQYPRESFQEQVEWQTENMMRTQHLLVRGSLLDLPNESASLQYPHFIPSYLLVCDDITLQMEAQRLSAWGEVAQRIAHEIRNPLTPIQLSAERLEKRLLAHLQPPQASLLTRAVHVIVSQVRTMQQMVDEFRLYARAPSTEMKSIDLNQLILDVLELYQSSQMSIQFIPGADLPYAIGDAGQLRQVIHNLLQNAQDATQHREHAVAHITTQQQDESFIQMVVTDNGEGFSDKVLTRLGEPYLTTKIRGLGLGLSIVKKIIAEHSGILLVNNIPEGGAMISFSLPIMEKKMSAEIIPRDAPSMLTGLQSRV